jgi:hypothetical protein
MREPAKSCVNCGGALQAAEVLYTESGEISCEACFAADGARHGDGRRGAGWRIAGHRTWQAGLAERARASQRRRIVHGIVFAWMVAGFFVAWRLLHPGLTIATIDTPAPTAAVPAELRVRGHVVAEGLHRPLWLVAEASGRCPSDPFFATRVVARRDGTWEAPVRLDGHRGQTFLMTIVAADELADAALERGDTNIGSTRRGMAGSAVLASREVMLGEETSLASRSSPRGEQ